MLRFSMATALAAGTIVLASAGCAGGTPPLGLPPAVAQPDGGASSMAPGAKSQELLYVTDLAHKAVNVYSYPAGKFQGKLTGFSAPHGLCSDKAGHVFVISSTANEIVEYAHGGKKPIRRLKDKGYFPQSCAVDPVNGTLAVTNSSSTQAGPGGVALYEHAKGPRKLYFAKATEATGLFRYYADSYDDKGNLYVDGTDNEGPVFEFAELPAGQTKFKYITLNYHVSHPGGVVWDGKDVAIGDQIYFSGPSPIYEFKIKGSRGTYLGTTPLNGSCDVISFALDAGTVIAPNDCGSSVGIWKYPAGGNLLRAIGHVGEPVSVVLSRKH